MRKNFPVVTAVFLALAFLVASAPAQETAAKPAARNVVLIGWDGAQRDHLKEMIGRGEVPNLLALSKEGALVDVDVITGATDTKAGWTQILTGYAPAKTGVFSNGKYQPIPVGYTVFERVEKFFGPDNVETVAIIGKKGHVDADAPRRVPYEQWVKREARQAKVDTARPGLGNLQGGRIVEENGRKFVETPGKPYYNTKSHMDEFVNGLVENDKVGEMALRELERCKDKRFFFFIHFADPDHTGHKFGENSQEYTDAIKSDDAWTGRIIAKLKEAGVYDRTLVYVVVDHGFNEGAKGHSYAPYVFLATNDKQVTRNGAREDIAPTVLKHLGLDVSKVEPAFDGIPLDQPAPERKAPAVKPGGAKAKRAAAGQAGQARGRAARKPDSSQPEAAGAGDEQSMEQEKQLSARFSKDESLGRLKQITEALDGYRNLVDTIGQKSNLAKDYHITVIHGGNIPENAEIVVRMSGKDLRACNGIGWEFQYIGFPNWVKQVQGYVEYLEYQNMKMRLELARLKTSDPLDISRLAREVATTKERLATEYLDPAKWAD